MTLHSLLFGPDETPVTRGLPAVLASAAGCALLMAWTLSGQSGGVVFPLWAVAVGLAGGFGYAYRYDALVVCVAVGVAAFAGSDLGFHAIHGGEPVVGTLVDFASDPEPSALGALFGGAGGVAGAAARRVVSLVR
ncbi:hypothetical protein [Halobacterium litoreum]|uniref:Uncharacterized protein n=1 Tax=Halobacterium litoreum TaxID=2039234 RepID=A0ABD5NE16_9EURY|nr:hypothetical protein [Halobacterium litoreum]UHH13797.1 hypothetical protein LT972_02085 [Halobacterium litoreum]